MPPPPPRDAFERYFAEKLWEWIPELHRHEDGIAAAPGALRALIEIAGAHAAVARRGIDRVWENQFAELADDWALPYIGDLVGTRLVSALNRAGRRADVARTIFYRRRKGTVAVLETLIRDIGRWDGAVVEAFRRLGRTPHRLDPPLAGPGAVRVGRVTRTPPGGLADLRAARASDLVDGPFDEFSHTADVRQLRGHLGRVNIPKLNFHLYRQLAFQVDFATPVVLAPLRFTFDPSGREVALFRPSQQDADQCTLAEEWRIAAPVTCRLLGEARYRLGFEDLPAAIAGALAPFVGITIDGETRFRATLATVLTPAQFTNNIYQLLAGAITDDSPKLHLLPSAAVPLDVCAVAVAVGADQTAAPIARQFVSPADLEIGAAPAFAPNKQLAIDPQRGLFELLAAPGAGALLFVPRHHVGLFGPTGAGAYDRRETIVLPTPAAPVTPLVAAQPASPGPIAVPAPLPTDGVFEVLDSKTYVPASPLGGTLTGIRNLTLQASNRTRPYVRLEPQGGGTRWTFRAQPKNALLAADDPANRRTLVIDGLWLGLLPAGLAPEILADPTSPATPVQTTIALDGVFDQVVLRHCTVDPGGERSRTVANTVTAIPYVRVELRGTVEELVVERSIVGPIVEAAGVGDPCSAARVVVRDSVVQSIAAGVSAIETRFATLVLERSTVFGDVVVDRLEASEALIDGEVRVTDNQHGCFRFSATQDGAAVRLPQQFESHLFAPVVPPHVFVSRRFGDAGYAQLSATAPDTLRRGAENGSEIGAWSRLLTPIKLDDLRAKAAEYMPFGLVAQFIEET